MIPKILDFLIGEFIQFNSIQLDNLLFTIFAIGFTEPKPTT
jgi:hypothetical protein